MTSFVIGTIIEPEKREVVVKGEKRELCNIGILSGKSCTQFDIWSDSKIYPKVSGLKQGDVVLAVIGSSVDGKGNLRCYLNSIGDCPDGLWKQLMSLVKS